VNDHWEGTFTPDTIGRYEYTVHGWIDHYLTWQKGLKKKYEANQDIGVELLIGAQLLEEAAERAAGADRDTLYFWANILRNPHSVAAAVSQARHFQRLRTADS
jgi:starch synthase (maltosyl-transferring)